MTAKDFAHAAHDSIGQKRKYTNEPYWVHTDAVEKLFATFVASEIGSAAAHFHDILEDVTPLDPFYSKELIAELFGFEVLSIVEALTEKYTSELYPQFNSAQRKGLECARLAETATSEHAFLIHSIKLADLINNTSDIVEQNPKFALVYLPEKEAVLKVLTKGHPSLIELAYKTLEEGKKKLGIL